MPDQIELIPYTDTWPEDDPDAGFRSMVTMFSGIDPLPTLETLSRNKNVPVGALARFILARYAASGSEALMEIGPRVIGQMNEMVQKAEAEDTDESRLEAYGSLSAVVSWLNIPLTDPDWRPGG
ncbi:MAG: DUF6027 family protein [Dehalococcoidia bacterium]|jgi:hypothetical protein|nr:DUF6027 family protein [Dehalococcoidia bacterium]